MTVGGILLCRSFVDRVPRPMPGHPHLVIRIWSSASGHVHLGMCIWSSAASDA